MEWSDGAKAWCRRVFEKGDEEMLWIAFDPEPWFRQATKDRLTELAKNGFVRDPIDLDILKVGAAEGDAGSQESLLVMEGDSDRNYYIFIREEWAYRWLFENRKAIWLEILSPEFAPEFRSIAQAMQVVHMIAREYPPVEFYVGGELARTYEEAIKLIPESDVVSRERLDSAYNYAWKDYIGGMG